LNCLRPSRTIATSMSKLSKFSRRILPKAVRRAVGAKHVCAAENVYHCCVHKTASQWLRKIFSDARTYRYCGLDVYNYEQELEGGADSRPLTARTFNEPFPARTIVTPIYIDLPGFQSIPKPEHFRAFFVPRDPRDAVVSWYFSVKLSHKVMNRIGEVREKLHSLSEEDGLCFVIDWISSRGVVAALRSWQQGAKSDSRLRIFRYEELTDENQFLTWQQLLAHCDIRMPSEVLQAVLADYAFSTLTKGRERGAEDVKSHLRKGVHGDWKNHFTPRVETLFRDVTGGLVEELGYSW
jgi:hypothetical protein